MIQKYTLYVFAAAFCAIVSIHNPANAAARHSKRTVPRLPSLPAPVYTGTLTTKPGPKTVQPAPPPEVKLPTTVVYSGQPGAQAGVTVSSWGGGLAAETSEMAYNGGNSFKITTLGYYQGAQIHFTKPLDLGDRSPAVNRILQVMIRFAPPEEAFLYDPLLRQARHEGRPAVRSSIFNGRKNFSLAQNDDDLGAAPPGPSSPVGGAPAPSGAPPTAATQPAPNTLGDSSWQPPFKTMRMLFTFANGAQTDVVRPVPEGNDDTMDRSSAWIPIGVPLSVLPLPAGSAASPLQSITIGGDSYAKFYVGEILLVNDTTPITCFAGDLQDVARADVVTLKATAQGGASTLKYSWDLDASDGISDQATGQTVKTQYFKGNKDYNVTLTVSDLDGIKKPAVSKTTVKVEE